MVSRIVVALSLMRARFLIGHAKPQAAGYRPYFASSSGKNLITDAIGLAATWPRPQIDVIAIVCDRSLTRGRCVLSKRRASISLMISVSFCEPSRHGTHLPHDSLR